MGLDRGRAGLLGGEARLGVAVVYEGWNRTGERLLGDSIALPYLQYCPLVSKLANMSAHTSAFETDKMLVCAAFMMRQQLTATGSCPFTHA